jgi:hypothetical protein
MVLWSYVLEIGSCEIHIISNIRFPCAFQSKTFAVHVSETHRRYASHVLSSPHLLKRLYPRSMCRVFRDLKKMRDYPLMRGLPALARFKYLCRPRCSLELKRVQPYNTCFLPNIIRSLSLIEMEPSNLNISSLWNSSGNSSCVLRMNRTPKSSIDEPMLRMYSYSLTCAKRLWMIAETSSKQLWKTLLVYKTPDQRYVAAFVGVTKSPNPWVCLVFGLLRTHTDCRKS